RLGCAWPVDVLADRAGSSSTCSRALTARSSAASFVGAWHAAAELTDGAAGFRLAHRIGRSPELDRVEVRRGSTAHVVETHLVRETFGAEPERATSEDPIDVEIERPRVPIDVTKLD